MVLPSLHLPWLAQTQFASLSTFHDWVVLTTSHPNDPLWCSWSGVKFHPNTSQIVPLDFSQCNIFGPISPQIRYLSSLINLNFRRNKFGGPLQPTIFQLSNLIIFDISHNDFNSTFPPGISKLNFFKIFTAYSNSFTGSLPQEFIKLRFLDPFIKLQFLEPVSLGGYFDGEIPKGYGTFPRLQFLYLTRNALNGLILLSPGFLQGSSRSIYPIISSLTQFHQELPR